MKLLISLLLVVASVPCFAKAGNVRVGDFVEYTFISSSGEVTPIRWKVLGFDKATGSYAAEYEINGIIFPTSFTNDDVKKLGSTKKTYKDCKNLGGSYDTLQIASETLSVCRIHSGFPDERIIAKEMRCSEAKRTVSDSTGTSFVLTVTAFNCR